MIAINEEEVQRDWSSDQGSRRQYKFHFVSSYLYCFVVDEAIEEVEYDELMEFATNTFELFTDDYRG